MSDHGSNGHHPPGAANAPAAPQQRSAGEERRSPWPLALVATLFVVAPFLTWYGTTFWRTLSDAEIEAYLADWQKPRRVQHALEEIDRRIVGGDAATRDGARRWYSQVVGVASSPSPELRLAAAWVMGDDNRAEQFHAALLPLLADPEPAVRRMAALSLSRFNDPRCRDELLAIFRPYSVRAPLAATVLTVLAEGGTIRREALLARLRDASGRTQEVRAPLSGKVVKVLVEEGATAAAGDQLLVLAPDGENVLQALRALYLVGRPEDLPEIERYARGVEGMPARVKEQAALTAEEIKRRAGRG